MKRAGQSMNREQRVRFFLFITRFSLRGVICRWQRWRLFGRNPDRAKRLLEANADKPLIFVVSYHKSGTRSIHELLHALRYRAMHWPDFVNSGIDYQQMLRDVVDDEETCVHNMVHLLDRYEAFSDVPFAGLYRELAAHFPKAKFILTYRPPEEWWNSVARHWGLDQGSRVLSTFEAIQYRMPLGRVVTTGDKEELVGKYRRHNAEVQEFFADDPRFFCAPLGAPDTGQRLALFLGHSAEIQMPRRSSGSVYDGSEVIEVLWTPGKIVAWTAPVVAD